MKYKQICLLITLSILASCSHSSSNFGGLRTKWEKIKTIWGDDTEGMLASEGFYGPIENEFVALDENDLQLDLASATIPQPRDIPGHSSIPSLNQFKKALAGLANIFQNLYFNTDDYVLRKPEYMSLIGNIATYLKEHPKTYICIGGHCDERGSEAYNLALGTRRSNYVRSLLVQRGVNPNNIHSVSHGKEQPVDPGHKTSAWARNRRVEFKLYEKP